LASPDYGPGFYGEGPEVRRSGEAKKSGPEERLRKRKVKRW
jgi:hypothetical protein